MIFNDPASKKTSENIVGKGQKCWDKAFFSFSQNFSTLSNTTPEIYYSVNWLYCLYGVVRCFQQHFICIAVASASIHAFLEFFWPVLHTILLPSHWLLSHITTVKTTNSGERGMNPVWMPIIAWTNMGRGGRVWNTDLPFSSLPNDQLNSWGLAVKESIRAIIKHWDSR